MSKAIKLFLLLVLIIAFACGREKSSFNSKVTGVTAGNSTGSSVDISKYPVYSVSAESGLNAQVILNWLAPDAPSGTTVQAYKIYRDTSTGYTPGAGNLISTVLHPTLNYTDAAVSNGTRYYYKIIATYGAGDSVASLEVNALPLNPAAGVDANNVFISDTGNDATGDGSFSNPYLTLSKGLTIVNANGNIFVKDGTYNIAADLNINIAVTIQSMTGDYRTSAALFLDSPAGTTRIFNYQTSNIFIKGLETRNIKASISTGLNTISFENNYIRDLKIVWLGYFSSGISNFSIYGNYFKNIGDRTGAGGYSNTASALTYWPSNIGTITNLNNNFSYNRIENPAWEGFQIMNLTGLSVTHNTFIDACDAGLQWNVANNTTMSVAGTNDISYNTFTHSYKAGGHPSCVGAGLLFYSPNNYNSGLVLNITHNLFETSDKAIDFSSGSCDFSISNPVININSNNILSTNTMGLDFNTCAGVLDVRNNYWGHSSGPNGNGNGGTGATINLGTATGSLLHAPFTSSAY
jgi:hypothetical protein